MLGSQPGHADADTRGAAEERHRASCSNVAVGRILSKMAVYSNNENKIKATGKRSDNASGYISKENRANTEMQ